MLLTIDVLLTISIFLLGLTGVPFSDKFLNTVVPILGFFFVFFLFKMKLKLVKILLIIDVIGIFFIVFLLSIGVHLSDKFINGWSAVLGFFLVLLIMFNNMKSKK